MLWAEKTGRVIADRTEAMRWGQLLEPVIIAELQERGYSFEAAPAAGLVDDARPWLVGHPDGYTELDGWPAVLEVKTANAWAGREWREDAGAPLAHVLQCHHYLELTGYSRALLACLVGGQRLELRTVSRDETVIARMLELEAAFLEHVKRDEPPPPDGSESARDALAALYPQSDESRTVRLDSDGWQEYETLKRRREQRDALDKQVARLEQRLKARMGDAATAIGPHDETAARWTTYERTALDAKALRQALPAIAADYETTTTLRRFTLE
jgi:predicted phage-related endonuclease